MTVAPIVAGGTSFERRPRHLGRNDIEPPRADSTTGSTGSFYNNSPQSAGQSSDPDYFTLSGLNAHLATLIADSLDSHDHRRRRRTSISAMTAMATTRRSIRPARRRPPMASRTTTTMKSSWPATSTSRPPAQYAFSTTSDDGSMLWIDNSDAAVVNNNNYQGATKASGTISLTAGLHAITIGFYQGGGGQGLLVQYDGPDTGVTNPTRGKYNHSEFGAVLVDQRSLRADSDAMRTVSRSRPIRRSTSPIRSPRRWAPSASGPTRSTSRAPIRPRVPSA